MDRRSSGGWRFWLRFFYSPLSNQHHLLAIVLVREAAQCRVAPSTPTEVELVIDYYICRWQIEVYYRVLKTGCKIEDIQLERADRLKPCLMLYKIVAWRVLYATMLGRQCPTLPCDVIFVEHEWKSVWTIATDSRPPKSAPPIQEFLILLAKLGGYNNRDQDGPPGPPAIWSGMRRMHDFALAWTKFGPGAATYV